LRNFNHIKKKFNIGYEKVERPAPVGGDLVLQMFRRLYIPWPLQKYVWWMYNISLWRLSSVYRYLYKYPKFLCTMSKQGQITLDIQITGSPALLQWVSHLTVNRYIEFHFNAYHNYWEILLEEKKSSCSRHSGVSVWVG
jgi:hypothetical protein